MSTSRAGRVAASAACAMMLAVATSACGGSSSSGSTSVFKVRAGQCFMPPQKVASELTSLKRVSCTANHTQEAYAVVAYRPPSVSASGDYPGDTALKTYADGACAQRFAKYVGIDYQDSSLFFTYLLPSARGWEQSHDRSVVCFVTTTGSLLHKSVKGSKA